MYVHFSLINEELMIFNMYIYSCTTNPLFCPITCLMFIMASVTVDIRPIDEHNKHVYQLYHYMKDKKMLKIPKGL